MSSSSSLSLMRRVTFRAALLGAVAAFTAGFAGAQSTHSSTEPGSVSVPADESSSLSLVTGDGAAAALPSAPAAGGSGAGQYGSNHRHSFASRLAFEAGGGFNAPTSDSSNSITWGGNFTVGGGYRFDRYLSVLAEYQFMDDKLPGAMIAQTGANGGNAHIWSFTLAPVVDLFPKRSNSIYVTGGGGFYRKVTNFTDPVETEFCDFYFCGIGFENATVGHFSSNQGGWNIGGGYTHRLGGIYGDGRAKLFAEVRYLDILTPAVDHLSPNGLGTTTVAADTKLIPVTFGVRW